VGRKCRPLHFNAPNECCPYSETFLPLSVLGNRHIHNESVFAHLFLKMWKFSEQKDRRTALILGIFYCEGRSVRPGVSHIYRVWGIGAFISVRVFPQPSRR